MRVESGFQVLKTIKVHPAYAKVLRLREDLSIQNDIFLPQKIVQNLNCLTLEGAMTLATLNPLLVVGKNDRCVGNLQTLFALKAVCSPDTEVPVQRLSGLRNKSLEELAAASFLLPQIVGGYRNPEYFLFFLSQLLGQDLVQQWVKDIFTTKANYSKSLRLNRGTLDDNLDAFRELFEEVLPRE